jgi:hypothetical protein
MHYSSDKVYCQVRSEGPCVDAMLDVGIDRVHEQVSDDMKIAWDAEGRRVSRAGLRDTLEDVDDEYESHEAPVFQKSVEWNHSGR